MLAFFDTFLATLFIITCILLIVVVLLQKGRGGGLSAAFGGMGSSAFGTRVGDVLTWVTIVMVALFLILATGTTLRFKPKKHKAPRPEFSLRAGSIVKPEYVTITGEKDAKIYYTTDNSEPSKDSKTSKLYTGRVLVMPGTTLKARQYVSGWIASEVAEARYLQTVAKPPKPAPATRPERAPAARPTTMPATTPATGTPG